MMIATTHTLYRSGRKNNISPGPAKPKSDRLIRPDYVPHHLLMFLIGLCHQNLYIIPTVFLAFNQADVQMDDKTHFSGSTK
jgi:hypothetical protein